MPWIAIGATVDNIVIAAADDILLLEIAAELDFDVIVRVYGVTNQEYAELKNKNYNYKIKFNNIRSTYLEYVNNKDSRLQEMSNVYSKRIELLQSVRGRYEHASNKYKPLFPHQYEIYEQKYKEALDIINNENSIYRIDGYVKDYAAEKLMEIDIAASLIIAKYNNWHAYLRKIERLRLRHFALIKHAKTDNDFTSISSIIDNDFFINMLM